LGEILLEGRSFRRDVFQEPRLVLSIHHATAPAIHKGRTRVGLEHCRELFFVRLPLDVLELNRHALVLSFIVFGDTIPKRSRHSAFLNVDDRNSCISEGWSGKACDQHRSQSD
jgi:hypothetical protein